MRNCPAFIRNPQRKRVSESINITNGYLRAPLPLVNISAFLCLYTKRIIILVLLYKLSCYVRITKSIYILTELYQYSRNSISLMIHIATRINVWYY